MHAERLVGVSSKGKDVRCELLGPKRLVVLSHELGRVDVHPLVPARGPKQHVGVRAVPRRASVPASGTRGGGDPRAYGLILMMMPIWPTEV